MSRTVQSMGLMVPLKTPLTRQQVTIASEALDEASSFLGVNYEGTLLYSDNGDNEEIVVSVISPVHMKKFQEEIKRLNIEVDFSKMSVYSCSWDNGTDSPMSDMTIARYLNKFEDN